LPASPSWPGPRVRRAQASAFWCGSGIRVDKGQPLYELHAETPGELAYALAYAESQTGVLTLSEAVS
jgi:hypothetical protein